MRGEFDWSEVPYPATQVGTSEAVPSDDESHNGHAFLYIPDLAAETGWSSHKVPTKELVRNDRQREPMGFRRR